MGRITFVAMLFVMAAACVIVAIGDRSWGWLVGSFVFISVAVMALRRLKQEQDEIRSSPRLSFVTLAILGMVIVMGGLFWMQFSA